MATETRIRRYTDQERKKFSNPLRCYDCNLCYGGLGWCDVVVPNDIWELINPTYHKGAGILCFNCISARLDWLGLQNISVKITSGPFINE